MLSSLPVKFNALVVGASRGIGLGMVQALAEHSSAHLIYAACRTPVQADQLAALSEAQPQRLRVLAADVTLEETLATAADTVRRETDRLHLVVNCVGLLHDADSMRPERRLADIKPDNFARSFAVNATGAMLLAKHFAGLLTHGERAVLANLSARVGSIGDNELGGWYAYRAAKSAQNQITRCLSIELKRRAPQLVVVALHPGTVDTGLSKPFQSNVAAQKLFSIERAATQLLNVVDGLSADDSGQFFAWDGAKIPW